jgi:acetaldehyde dehydrogenase/alcohol dehydrogenase
MTARSLVSDAPCLPLQVPKDIYFSRNATSEALQDAGKIYPNGLGDKRAIIITDAAMVEFGHVKKLEEILQAKGIETHVFSDVTPDPTIGCCRKGLAACERFQPDLMIALGGGSPMDAAKMIRVMYEAPGVELADLSARFIELRKRTHEFPEMGTKIHRLFAIPTTSGTGSEVTPFSVITDDDGMKHPLFSYSLTPDVAIVDSSYTDKLPKSLVANAGIDALVHAVESYVSVAANDYTRSLSKQAVELIFEYLPTSYEKGTWDARQKVHNAATIAGLAFSNAGLGITHSMSHKVGGAFHTPHGLTNSLLMNAVIDYNCAVNPTRQGIYPQYTHPQAKKRYSELARAIGCNGATEDELVEQFKDRITKLQEALNIPATFAEAGIGEAEFLDRLDDMALNSFDDQCTGLNPRMPLVSEIKELYLTSYYGK